MGFGRGGWGGAPRSRFSLLSAGVSRRNLSADQEVAWDLARIVSVAKSAVYDRDLLKGVGDNLISSRLFIVVSV